MQELFVDTPKQLNALCEQLRGSPWLALDTEFVREKTYHPNFCLLQVANGEVAACVDPLVLDDITPLLDIIFDSGITKVFHAARQDLEIFQHLWQRLPVPLFDTQLAATLLGMGDQVGYGNLVKKTLGLELEKGHARTDWARRPLQETQLRYALDDVIYLG
ncbi:MAG: ribonuclease D, partial [Candidatus Sedimenticola sp. 6PFRAG7]